MYRILHNIKDLTLLSAMFDALSAILTLLSAMFDVLSAILALLSAMFETLSAILLFQVLAAFFLWLAAQLTPLASNSNISWTI